MWHAAMDTETLYAYIMSAYHLRQDDAYAAVGMLRGQLKRQTGCQKMQKRNTQTIPGGGARRTDCRLRDFKHMEQSAVFCLDGGTRRISTRALGFLGTS